MQTYLGQTKKSAQRDKNLNAHFLGRAYQQNKSDIIKNQ